MSNALRKNRFVFPSVEQSFLTVIVFSIKADGVFSQSEKEVLKDSLLTMELFKDYSEAQLSDSILKALLRIEIKGEEAVLVESVQNIPPELHQTLLRLVAELIISDLKITKAEKEILDKIQQMLSIPTDLAARTINIALDKRKLIFKQH